MTDLLISTEPTLVAYNQRVEINEVTYSLRFYWNDRAQSWFVDILNDSEIPLAMGRKCNVGSDLISQSHYQGVPQGSLVPWDTSQRDVDPFIDDFGTRVILLYLEL